MEIAQYFLCREKALTASLVSWGPVQAQASVQMEVEVEDTHLWN